MGWDSFWESSLWERAKKIGALAGIGSFLVAVAWFSYTVWRDRQSTPNQGGSIVNLWTPTFVIGCCVVIAAMFHLTTAFVSRRNLKRTVADLTQQNTGLRSDAGRLQREKGLCQDNYRELEKQRDRYSSELADVRPQIESLNRELAQAKNDGDNANKRAKAAENESQGHYKLFEDRERQLGELLWLKKRMEDQAKDISEHVVVKKSKLCGLRLDSDRCAFVAITIRNESLFDITIRLEKISGCLFFNSVARHDPAQVSKTNTRPIENLEPMAQAIIVIKQPLLRTEAEIISEAAKDQNARFWLGNLNIPISIENIPQQVGTKALRIGENVEHVYLKDYNTNDPLEEMEAREGRKLTMPELRGLIDELAPAERAQATKAALELFGESFYEEK